MLLTLNDAGPQPAAPTGCVANADAPRVQVICCSCSLTVAKKPECCGHGTAWGTVASGGITPQPAMDWPITAYDGAAATVCGLVRNGHHHFAVDILGLAQLDTRRCLRKAKNLAERQAVAQIIRPQGKAFQRNLGLAAERLFCGGSAAVEVGTRQASVDQRLAYRDARALQAMVAILLQAAARDAAP